MQDVQLSENNPISKTVRRPRHVFFVSDILAHPFILNAPFRAHHLRSIDGEIRHLLVEPLGDFIGFQETGSCFRCSVADWQTGRDSQPISCRDLSRLIDFMGSCSPGRTCAVAGAEWNEKKVQEKFQ